MNISFNKVELHNFLSFENACIEFTSKGFISIIGNNFCIQDNSLSNGSGKSSLWESIVWALTGETIRGSKEVKRLGSEDECYVNLYFTINNDNYCVKRYKSPSKLFIIKNEVDISGKGIRDSEKILLNLLPDLTPQLIGSVIILGQGLPQRFSSNTPSGRKEVLEKLSKSDFMIEDIKDRIIKRKTQLSSEIRSNEDKKISIETTIKNCIDTVNTSKINKDNLPNIEECLKNIDLLTEESVNYESILSSVEEKLKDYTSKSEETVEKIKNISSTYDSLICKVEDEHRENLSAFKEEVNKNVLKIREIENEIQRIKNIKEVCPTCGQKLINVHKPSTESLEIELEKVKLRSNESNNAYNSLVEYVQDKISQLKKEKEEETKDLSTEHLKISTEIKNLIKERTEISTLLSTVKSKISKLSLEVKERDSKLEFYNSLIKENEDKIASLNSDLLYINNVIDNLTQHLDVVSKFEIHVKRNFRGYLLKNIIEYINSQAKSYCKDIFNTELISFDLDGNNISISYNGKEYECLSGGEKQKVDLIVQFSLRDMLCNYLDFSSNILVLDEITDNLDTVGCQKVFNLISSKLNDVEAVYIISHHSDLQFPIDYQLIINKGEDGISRIQ